MKVKNEGVSATILYILAVRTGDLNVTDEPTPPTTLQGGETSTGVITCSTRTAKTTVLSLS